MMELLASLLQVIAIYLLARGGIVLALAGFRPEEVRYVKATLTTRLNNSALVILTLAVFYGIALVLWGDFTYVTNLPPLPKEKAEAVNREYWACVEAYQHTTTPVGTPRDSPLDCLGRAYE